MLVLLCRVACVVAPFCCCVPRLQAGRVFVVEVAVLGVCSWGGACPVVAWAPGPPVFAELACLGFCLSSSDPLERAAAD